jgi:hypothetical protein
LMTVGTRIISFLCRLREASTVKQIDPSRTRGLSPKTDSHTDVLVQCILPSRTDVCSLIFNKSLGCNIP